MNEKTAREVVKDLVKGDICEKRLLLKDEEIKNLQEQNDELLNIINIKDSISNKKDQIIKLQDKAIGWWRKPEIHGYIGIQTINTTLVDPYLYGTLLLKFKKVNIGARYFVQPNNPSMYGIIVEYNIF